MKREGKYNNKYRWFINLYHFKTDDSSIYTFSFFKEKLTKKKVWKFQVWPKAPTVWRKRGYYVTDDIVGKKKGIYYFSKKMNLILHYKMVLQIRIPKIKRFDWIVSENIGM